MISDQCSMNNENRLKGKLNVSYGRGLPVGANSTGVTAYSTSLR